MKITNKKNLPDVIVRAIEGLIYPPSKENRINVTSLIRPPIVHQLLRRHWNELEEDAIDSVWRLLGTAIHKVIEGVTDKNISEKKGEKDFGGIVISGKADVVDGSELYDYKVTSAWHSVFSQGLPKDWVRQMNVYAYLFGDIKSAKIIAIYRDWIRSKAIDADYPPEPLMAFDVALADKEEQEKYILERVKLHSEASALPDDMLPICTPEERWQKPTTWAIYRNENKIATRVFNSKEKAEKYAGGLTAKMTRVSERPGEDKKCLYYCPVKKFCHYGKSLEKGGEI